MSNFVSLTTNSIGLAPSTSLSSPHPSNATTGVISDTADNAAHTQEVSVAPIKIDLDSVLRTRLASYYRFIPKCVVRWLERTICQDGLNTLLRDNAGLEGAEFCRGVLRDLDVSYKVEHADRLPDFEHRRVVFVSNHPLGALDGIAYIELLGKLYGKVYFVVNDLLGAVAPLKSVFVQVDKHGRQTKNRVSELDSVFAGDDPVLFFPAGLCSRKGADGTISDLTWKKTFLTKAIEHKRDIVPLHFGGTNSAFFYNFARLRSKLGLKFNVEMIYLPREIFLARGREFTITVGPTISCDSFRGGSSAMAEAQEVKKMVYSLVTPTGSR